MIHKNKEGYPDPTAGDAIREADRPPELVSWCIKIIKNLAEIFDLEVIGRVTVKDKSTGRIYR